MCGIYGHYTRSPRVSNSLTVERMGPALKHRGPDESGEFDAGHMLIGNQRLSVMDVEHGRQPFVSDCGQVAVVQNGEIYNFPELAEELTRDGAAMRTRCDTEVILHLYLLHGPDFANRLNGMFAIAIADKRNGTLTLYRDRIGVKPLFITEHSGTILFASEIKSLVAAGVPAEIDRHALDLFLSFNFVPPPSTIIQGIQHVEPGTMVEISADGIKRKHWWRIAEIIPGVTDVAPEEVLDTLRDAVRIRMRCDVPYGAFLSGGIDSSSVVGLMSQSTDVPIATYAIGFDDKRFDESQFAAEAAARFGTRHTMKKLGPSCFSNWPDALFYCDQPHGDVSFVPTLALSELASADVKVVLTGDGGDELYAGYEKYQRLFDQQGETMPPADFLSRLQKSLTLFPDDLKAEICGDYFRGLDAAAPANYVSKLVDEVPHFDQVNQSLYVDCRMLLPGNNLVKPDRMAMAKSLEARTPFLDYRMVEQAFAMPGNQKLRDGETKHILKKAVAPLIGDNLTYREKQMFTVPVGEWFKAHLQSYMGDTLGRNGLGGRGIFDAGVVGRLMDEHQDGTVNRTRELRALMAIELWIREFVEGEAVRDPWWKPEMVRMAANS